MCPSWTARYPAQPHLCQPLPPQSNYSWTDDDRLGEALSMGNFPRIRPYRTLAVTGRGARREVKAHELALERPASVATGGDLEINLAPHPNFKGWVSFATYRTFGLTIEPGSSSHAYVLLQDMPVHRRRRGPATSSSRISRQHVYLVDATGRK